MKKIFILVIVLGSTKFLINFQYLHMIVVLNFNSKMSSKFMDYAKKYNDNSKATHTYVCVYFLLPYFFLI